MEEIYRAEGTVHRGFVGQITYTVCLEKPLTKMDIHFWFDADKRTFSPEEATRERIQETQALCREKYGMDMTEEEARHVILHDMKTEIHTLATMDDQFMGCVHKQLTDRHMIFDGEYASEGCVPQRVIDGVIKVTVLVFNVIKDHTHYALTLSGE